MADLDGLKAMHAWMREVGCLYAKCDGLELHLQPAPVRLDAVPEDKAHADAVAQLDMLDADAVDELLMSGDGSARDAILSLNRRVA